MRLISLALNHWREIDGWAVGHGLDDLRKLPLSRFCSFMWWYATKDAEGSEVAKFEARLWRPVPGAVAQGPWSPEAETAAFKGLKAQLQPNK